MTERDLDVRSNIEDLADKPEDWTEVVADYAAQLTAAPEQKDTELLANLEDLIFVRIFNHPPEEAKALYTALCNSPDRQVRATALSGLRKLAAIDPLSAHNLLGILISDQELIVREAAFRFYDR